MDERRGNGKVHSRGSVSQLLVLKDVYVKQESKKKYVKRLTLIKDVAYNIVYMF